MTSELRLRIQQARMRLRNISIPLEEEITIARQKELDEFKVYLAKRIDILLRFELQLNYLWNEAAPAAQFTIDSHTFFLTQDGEDCLLSQEVSAKQMPIVLLLGTDTSFEDNFLLALGDVLE